MNVMFYGYELDIDDSVIGLPCACDECRHKGEIQDGHYRCFLPPEWVLQKEREQEVEAAYDDGGWKWFATRKGNALIAKVREAPLLFVAGYTFAIESVFRNFDEFLDFIGEDDIAPSATEVEVLIGLAKKRNVEIPQEFLSRLK